MVNDDRPGAKCAVPADTELTTRGAVPELYSRTVSLVEVPTSVVSNASEPGTLEIAAAESVKTALEMSIGLLSKASLILTLACAVGALGIVQAYEPAAAGVDATIVFHEPAGDV
jgi:hypothetical protein